MRRILLLVALALAGCGGDDSGNGFNVEDYVDADLLARAENDHQRACIIDMYLPTERWRECGAEFADPAYDVCESLEMPVDEAYTSTVQCYERWATASCKGLEGPEDDPCRLAVEGYFDER